MKKLVLKVTSGPEYSFSYTHESRKYFFDEFHYHPEFELTLIIRGRGTRFVGDHIESFGANDLSLIGPDLPHVWKSASEYYKANTALKSESISIHFSHDFLGQSFLDAPELRRIKSTLEHASRGFEIAGRDRGLISRKLIEMERQNNTQRLLTFLGILDMISNAKHLRTLSSEAIIKAYDLKQDKRITKGHQYIITHFRDVITLDSIAQVANMSPTAFCRYFKQRTRKSFTQFLLEIRVGFACQLLQEKDMKIADICCESGFINLSNFNKQFKHIMDLTPQEYRKAFSDR